MPGELVKAGGADFRSPLSTTSRRRLDLVQMLAQ
jgi:hypothetical protein